METITLDFETYYDREYSLSKMQTDEYILDDRFEAIMVYVTRESEGGGTFIMGTEEEIKQQLQDYCDWSQFAVRAHHAQFDGFILAARYGVRPGLWKCTLSQARMLHPHLKSHSLANMAKFYGLKAKGTAVGNMLGKRLVDMNDHELVEYMEYCRDDTEICESLGKIFDTRTPPLEMHLIDMTVRMFTEPTLVGDADMIKELRFAEIKRKEELLELANLERDTIMSNAKFAAYLESLGVTVPMKTSPRTGKQTYAFAKTDQAFTDLADDPDERVAAAVCARLGAKTTIAETRAERFYNMANRGPLAVYLHFWGAKTTGRYSGGNSVNWQNLPARGISAGLRKAIKAPPGHKVLVGDSSNIELRTVMCLAGQDDVIEKIAAGVDMYCDFASTLFGRTITKADAAERFLGKTAMLGLQYGAGAERFREMVRIASVSVPGVEPITLDFAHEVVQVYRTVHYKVVELWDYCQKVVIPAIANGDLVPVDVHGLFLTNSRGFSRPNEPGVVYDNLRYEGDEWVYDMGRATGVRIYGPKLVENLCQHAAMKIVMWQTARINRRYPVKLSVHDEVVCVPRLVDVDDAKAYMTECLSLTPKWCRGLIPVACEVEVGDSYGDAK